MKLNKIMSSGRQVDGGDVLLLKNELGKRGYYNAPDYGITEYPDKLLFDGIRQYQKDNGLKVDGVIRPDGETIASLSKNNSDRLGVRSPRLLCPVCGGFHGGVFGDVCHECILK